MATNAWVPGTLVVLFPERGVQHGRDPRTATEVRAQADAAPRDVADELPKLETQKRRLLA